MATGTLLILCLVLLSIGWSCRGLSLVQSDLDAFVGFSKSVGLPGQPRWRHPCATAGVRCSRNRIVKIELDSMHLKGFIPPCIGGLTELRVLSLANNNLSSKLPPEIADCRKLEVLNLRHNRISGETKEEKTTIVPRLPPRRHRLAEEKINSTGPSINIAPKSSPQSGNRTRNSTAAVAPASPRTTPKKKHKKRSATKWVAGFVGGALTGILSGLLVSLLFRMAKNIIRGRRKLSGIEIFSPMIKRAEDLEFLEREDGVASLEIVGRGGCGEKIISTPAQDVVDLSEEDSKLLGKRMRQIRSEIQTVGHIRHRNLLPLLAHVARPDCHYLVYEYMKNGSLQDFLNEVSAGRRELEWAARHRIACGIAAGLEYLHLHHSPRIIHRDLKPANVLLDDDLVARITDFGLAKGLPEANTHMTTSNVVGTLGFIAPEYHQTLKFTVKCDIYSFGVLLAVLVVGKLPSDAFFQSTEELSMVKWLRNVMGSPDPSRAINATLLGNGYEDQMLLLLKIACFCTVDDPKERPNSKEVRTMLEQVKH
ncbi:hypothetical protein H6P81_012599 [Aristolochia fimbriata]|uniref:Protein kinase domain-containing protein n=1 Tax=Aristolochia fimbriata TaxID=158543 RepID=A0AAV7EF38_ARIFI|nr:hypothetical protein H6P81_012599 [Aristolochia fimbriata]